MPSGSGPLSEYRKKRDFQRSPEPEGTDGESGEGGAFVVQKHAARSLHYDLRLEMDGALRSWAVPKGPSLDPEVRVLAVQVEDHPLEYGSFEGVIPQGEYGGGTVMVWDRGRWHPDGTARAGVEKGHLSFRLAGEKLKGRWHLVRMKGRAGEDGKNWLLTKAADDRARSAEDVPIVESAPRSVVSGRDMDEIADAADRVWRTEMPPVPDGAPRRPRPREVRPQLPTLVKEAPEGDAWLHELKLDGVRILAWIDGGEVRLRTRRGHDWTDRFPEIVEALRAMGDEDAILDGEVVVLQKDGTTDFQALQNVMRSGKRDRLVLFLFDLLRYRGHDLTGLPLAERKETLQALLAQQPGGGRLRYSDHIVGEGPGVLANACRHGLEGVVSKRIRSPYREGRTRAWVKSKCLDRQELVVGGWTDPSGARSGFGALLLGWYDSRGRLIYAGRVGTGFTELSLTDLRGRLDRLAADRPPFDDLPTGAAARDVHWVRPELVAEVEYGSWTEDGILRHASFQGLREDKDPREVTREMPKTTVPNEPNRVAGVRLSNAGRVLYPEQGLTKGDLAKYFETVSDWILPHLEERPLTLVRCPGGSARKCFYQKHLTEGIPAPVRGIEIEEKEESALYVGVNDLVGLVTLVQFGVLEIHPWGSRADRLDRPDRLIFDLDPGEGVGWPDVVAAARHLRGHLEELGLTTFLRSTGGKGLHLVSPITRRSTWDQVKGFAKSVALGLEREHPDRFVATASKARRKGRIFVDYLRNGRGATAVASYSTRARPGAPVATPLRWGELSRLPASDHYSVENLPARLKRLGSDPWEGFFALRQSLTNEMLERSGSRRGG